MSAHRGALDTKANPLTLDVFGRVLAYKLLKASDKKDRLDTSAPIVANLMVLGYIVFLWGTDLRKSSNLLI
jgi:hypothetical protein